VTVAGQIYDEGFCNGSGPYYATFDVGRAYDYFEAWVGVADQWSGDDSSAVFTVECDGSIAYQSEPQRRGAKATFVSIPIKGVRALTLSGRGANGPRAVWADPRLIKGNPSRPARIVDTAQGGQPADFVVDPRDLDKLADGVWKKVSASVAVRERMQNARVAVATFELIDVPSSSVARNVAEDLYTAMINSGFNLVERGQLDKVLRELKIQNMGLVNPQTAQKIGQLSGCDVILLGSISDRGQFVVINARVMDTATGKSLVAERVEMRKIPIEKRG
jgi:TolB-like protein